MSLLDLWRDSPSQVKEKRVRQIIAFSGSGQLSDRGESSAEFREFLGHAPSAMLSRFAWECLENSFPDSGFALQDIVNQVGKRLGFAVEYGHYRGVSGEIGHDGIWRRKDDIAIVVEIKTTDSFRIDLDIPARYRNQLIRSGAIEEGCSSILVVVGRQDTGDLEAQVRGSRHAWDMRLISVDRLLRLMHLREDLEDPFIFDKISGILTPQEYTKVDGIVDLVFLAAEDVKEERSVVDDSVDELKEKQFTPVNFHEACIERIQQVIEPTLVKQSRAAWRSPGDEVSVVCIVSRAYEKSTHVGYWFAFHPYQQEFLESAATGWIACGCGSSESILMIPLSEFSQWLDGLHMTEAEDRTYWHLRISQHGEKFLLDRRKGYDSIDLSEYLLAPE